MTNFSTHGFAVSVAIFLAGAVGNVLLIVAHIVDPLKLIRSKSSVFIFNITIADFLLSFPALFAIVFFQRIPGDRERVLFAAGIAVEFMDLFCLASFTSYLGLAIERFCSVVFPLWHRVNVTTQKCRYVVAGIWAVGVILKIGFAILVRWVTNIMLEFNFALIIFLWLLFLSSQCVYVASCFSTRRQSKELRTRTDMNETTVRTTTLRLKNESNFLVTITIICFIQAATILPFLTMSFVMQYKWTKSSENIYNQADFAFPAHFIWGVAGISVNPGINVLIYIWRLPKYRKTFQKLYCDC